MCQGARHSPSFLCSEPPAGRELCVGIWSVCAWWLSQPHLPIGTGRFCRPGLLPPSPAQHSCGQTGREDGPGAAYTVGASMGRELMAVTWERNVMIPEKLTRKLPSYGSSACWTPSVDKRHPFVPEFRGLPPASACPFPGSSRAHRKTLILWVVACGCYEVSWGEDQPGLSRTQLSVPVLGATSSLTVP